jgi:hypothetical protein
MLNGIDLHIWRGTYMQEHPTLSPRSSLTTINLVTSTEMVLATPVHSTFNHNIVLKRINLSIIFRFTQGTKYSR